MAKHIIHITRTEKGIQNHPDTTETIEYLTTAWSDLGGHQLTIYAVHGAADFLAIADVTYPTSADDDVLASFLTFLTSEGEFRAVSERGYEATEVTRIHSFVSDHR